MFPNTIAKLTMLYGFFLEALPTLTEVEFLRYATYENDIWAHREEVEAMAAEEDAEQEAYERILRAMGRLP